MYELQSTLSTYAKRKYSSGEISVEHLKNILKVRKKTRHSRTNLPITQMVTETVMSFMLYQSCIFCSFLNCFKNLEENSKYYLYKIIVFRKKKLHTQDRIQHFKRQLQQQCNFSLKILHYFLSDFCSILCVFVFFRR